MSFEPREYLRHIHVEAEYLLERSHSLGKADFIQHETLRRVIESGQPIDQTLMDRLLGGEKRVDRDLKVAGLIVMGAHRRGILAGLFARSPTPAVLHESPCPVWFVPTASSGRRTKVEVTC